MADQPPSGCSDPPDPFFQVIRLLQSWLAYFRRLFLETGGGLVADHMSGKNVWPHVYVLQGATGTDEALERFHSFWSGAERPSTQDIFEAAVRAGRALASASGIPFEDYDDAFQNVSNRHNGWLRMSLMSAWECARLFPDATTAECVRLDRIPSREATACEPMIERLVAFSDHVTGRGWHVAVGEPREQGGRADNPTQESIDEEVGDDTPLPDGPFDMDGFRYRGVEVRFGRAAMRRNLVLALWDASTGRPHPARKVQDVISEVWGAADEATDEAFRQMCFQVRNAFAEAGLPLTIENLQGKVQLVPLSS